MNKFCFLMFFICTLGLGALMSSCNGDDPVTPTPPEDLKVAIVEIVAGESTFNSVTVNFIPNSETTKYIYAIGNENDRSDFENGLLEGILTQEDNSPIEHTFNDLVDGEKYTVFAAGYNSDGDIHSVQTCSVQLGEADFQLDIQFIAANCAAINLAVSYDFMRYEYALHEGSDASGKKLYYGSKEEVFGYTHTYFDLLPETDYFFVAKTRSRQGKEVKRTVAFKTKSLSEVSAVNLNIEDLDIFAGTFNVTPANELTGAIAIMYCTPGQYDPSWEAPTVWQGDLASMITSMGKSGFVNCYYSEQNGMSFYGTGGNFAFEYDLQVIAVSYYKDSGEIGNIQYFDFATPAYDPDAAKPGPMTINIVNVERMAVECSYVTGDNTLGFIVQTFRKSVFENDFLPKEIETPGYIGNYIYQTHGINYAVYCKLPFDTWRDTSVWMNDDFYAVAVPFNVNGPEFGWGDVAYVEFRTPGFGG